MRSSLILALLLPACGVRDPGVDNPLGAFTMQWEPVIDATPDMVLALGETGAWVIIDEELTTYDGQWEQVSRVGGVQAAASVLDVGLWLSNGNVLRSESGSAGALVALPEELGTPLDLRRGDGGEVWILGQDAQGGTLASSVDAGLNWGIKATGLTAGGAVPETLELRNTLAGIVVVQATSTAAGASTTYRVTGSGAEEWQDGAFLSYPAARLPQGWVGTALDERLQFDASTAGFAESWSPDAPEEWHWTHATGLDLSPERVPLTVLAASAEGVVYARDDRTLFRTTTAFAPAEDQADVVGSGVQCDMRYRIDWQAETRAATRDVRIRNGFAEEIWLYRIEQAGLVPLHEDPVAPESGAPIALGLDAWLLVTDAAGSCLYVAAGRDLRGGDYWVEGD